MGKFKEETINQMNETDYLVKIDSDIKEIDRLYKKSLKAISQTNDAKIKKLIEKENNLSLRAYETAIIALYDYKKWFSQCDKRNKDDIERCKEIDFAINRLNQLIQEM